MSRYEDTRPDAGSIRTMKSVCHTFAHTSPSTSSSSSRLCSGRPFQVTGSLRVGTKRCGSR